MKSKMKKGTARRGSALLVVAYFAIILTGVSAYYFYDLSRTASSESTTREYATGAQAAAEYAAEKVIANLSNMEYKMEGGERVSIEKDWVGRNPYNDTPGDLVGKSERVVTGVTEDGLYSYTVLVRAVREAKEAQEANVTDAQPLGWLSQVDLKPYEFGESPIRKFTGAYEVISSAQKVGSESNPASAAYGAIRTVVSLNYNSAMNDLDDIAVIHYNQPGNMQVSGNDSYTGTGSGGTGGTDADLTEWGGGEGFTSGKKSFQVSGEDHYAKKGVFMDPDLNVEIEGLAAIPVPSQLYSVFSDDWNWGRLTLHYMNGATPNPSIPRTYDFAAAITSPHRQMVTLDPSRDLDEYVFGGKRNIAEYYERPSPSGGKSNITYGYGRSVTLDENRIIKETSGGQATPSQYAEAALAVGSVENMLKLYLNFSGTHPALSAPPPIVDSWKNNQWRQLFIGYHTKNRTKSHIPESRRPLDNINSPARRRWTVLCWIKNEKGQFLVRDYTYPNPGSIINKELPTNRWNGKYRWMNYDGYVSGGRQDSHYHFGYFTRTGDVNQDSRYSKVLHTRMLTIEELIGYRLLKDKDGIPCKVRPDLYDAHKYNAGVIPDSAIVAGVPDYLLDSSTNQRIPVDYGNGSQFDESYQRQIGRTDNSYATPASLSSAPPMDGIYVYDDDTNNYVKYTTVRDFSFMRDISTSGRPEDQDLREMVTLHMVVEDDAEVSTSGSAYPPMYFDMGLTVTIVYPKKIEWKAGENDFLKDTLRQWWEGDPQASLTGDKSHHSISSNPTPDMKDIEGEEERLQAFFERLGVYEPGFVIDSVYTMVDDDGKTTDFPKAYLKEVVEGGDIGKIDWERMGYKEGEPTPPRVYITINDIFTAINLEPEKYTMSYLDPEQDILKEANFEADTYKRLLFEKAISDALNVINRRNIGTEILPILDRFDELGKNKSVLSEDNLSSLLLPETAIWARQYVAEHVFGFQSREINAVYVKWVETMPGKFELSEMIEKDFDLSGTMNKLPYASAAVPFVAGEFRQQERSKWFAKEVLSNGQDYASMMLDLTKGHTQPSGELLDGKFFFETNDSPLGNMVPITGTSDKQKIRDWFGWPNETDLTNLNAFECGNMIAKAPLKLTGPGLMNKILADLPYEHRGQLGWHREGAEIDKIKRPEENLIFTDDEYKTAYLDHYEYVMMGMRAFNPYMTISAARDGESPNHEYLAYLPVAGGDPQKKHQYEPKLKPANEMPTFVFTGTPSSGINREVDGAGILVVNGNLVIRNRFAYHGLLIVLGDVTVVPEQYLIPKDKEGKVYNSEGTELTHDPVSNTWFYMHPVNGKTESEPRKQWFGELIVQGQMLVGGNMTVATGDPSLGIPDGIIDARGSWKAIEETVGLWTKVAPNERFMSNRMNWVSNVRYTPGDLLRGN